MPESTPLADAGPNDKLIFSVVPKDGNGEQVGEMFSPEFYPERFNKVMEKDLNRDGQQCKGEDVSINEFQNPDIHATGECFANNVSTLEEIHFHDGKVDLYTPISPHGGIEAYVKKVEVGEMTGWNPHEGEWMFSYTIDFVSTGYDEYGNDGRSGIVSTLLASSSSSSSGSGSGGTQSEPEIIN